MRTYILLFSIILVSCKKFVDINPPSTQLQTADVFSTDQGATSAITGLYTRISNGNMDLLNGGMPLFTGLSADELDILLAGSGNDNFRSNSLLPTSAALGSALWNAGYRHLYHVNSILKGLSGATSLSDSVVRQIRGEALFMRAHIYFQLIQLFGDVPLVMTTDYEVNATLPRTPVPVIMDQMIADLLQARDNMAATYAVSNRIRPNKMAAAALLARLYLYKGEFQEAEEQSTFVIANTSMYDLVALNSVFQSQTSKETIWQLAKDNGNTAEAGTFVPTSPTVRPNYTLTAQLIAGFQPGDARRTAWVGSNTVSGMQYFYPYKYKTRVATPVTEYNVVLRLAEQYLVRAEARAMQNNTAGAIADLNRIRTRATLSSLTYTDMPALLAAIAQENRIEFFCEWGHRWMDLKRTGKADAVLGPFKGAEWSTHDQLYPVPQGELDLNPFLTQNPGY